MVLEPGQSSTQSPFSERRQALRRHKDHQLVRRDRELEAARRISATLFENLAVDELLEKALATALEVVGADVGSILLAVADSQQLVF